MRTEVLFYAAVGCSPAAFVLPWLLGARCVHAVASSDPPSFFQAGLFGVAGLVVGFPVASGLALGAWLLSSAASESDKAANRYLDDNEF